MKNINAKQLCYIIKVITNHIKLKTLIIIYEFLLK